MTQDTFDQYNNLCTKYTQIKQEMASITSKVNTLGSIASLDRDTIKGASASITMKLTINTPESNIIIDIDNIDILMSSLNSLKDTYDARLSKLANDLNDL